MTKWEEYAKGKGILNKKKSRMVWDETSQVLLLLTFYCTQAILAKNVLKFTFFRKALGRRALSSYCTVCQNCSYLEKNVKTQLKIHMQTLLRYFCT